MTVFALDPRGARAPFAPPGYAGALHPHTMQSDRIVTFQNRKFRRDKNERIHNRKYGKIMDWELRLIQKSMIKKKKETV